MPLSSGSLYGRYNGASIGFAFNTSNANNPNTLQAQDIVQVLTPGGNCIFQLTNSGIANINSAVKSSSQAVLIKVPMVITGYNSLPANPSAAQIWAAVTPLNYFGAQEDIIQITNDTAMNAVEGGGGGAIIFRLLYNGAVAYS